jgi:RecB family endonuclease NucS
VYFSGRQIIAIRRRPHEVLKINIHDVAWVEVAIASEGEFKLQGSHEDVKDWVVINLPRVTNCPNARLIGTEVPLNGHGVADVVADCNGARIIIEVKRGVVDLNAVSQLKRYVDALPNAKGVLVGAWFTSGALELARELGFRVVEY